MSESVTEQPVADLEQPAPAAERVEQAEPQEQPRDDSKWEKRVNRLTSRVTTVTRERDELAGRIAALEQQHRAAATGEQPLTPELQEYIRREGQRVAALQLAEERARQFHAAGQKAHEDWPERCQNLMAMGADKSFADLLVEMPDGARIAGELADDPEAVERIAAIGSERGRAIALGQYAAQLEARTPRRVSRAPKPPTPVTGRTSPQFDEYNAQVDDLVAYYKKQAMEQQRR